MKLPVPFLTLVYGFFAFATLAPTVLADAKNFHDQKLNSKDFSGKDLRGADFSDAILNGCNFSGTDVEGANFKGTEFPAAVVQFFKTVAKGADFRGSKPTWLSATLANFSGANFEGVDLRGASFYECNFRGANLKNSTGLGAVQGCDFERADLRGANLRTLQAGNSGEGPTRFRGAIYDEKTIWPEGFDPKEAGAILNAAR